MKLTEINIYPIKSVGRIPLTEAKVLPAGLEYDRRWMLLDENGTFMTQRHYPQLALVNFSRAKNGFKATYKNVEPILIPFEKPASPVVISQVWDDKVEARKMGKIFNDWFSEIANTKCELVRIEENAVRKSLKGEPDKISSFADGASYLIIGEKSLEDLNNKLDTPVPMSRFRPNFVFSGGEAFCEDEWNELKIGQIKFKKHKKCGRCKITTINQDTGIKMGDEPLATLSSYRKEGRKIYFGITLFLGDGQEEGTIKLNEEVIVIGG